MSDDLHDPRPAPELSLGMVPELLRAVPRLVDRTRSQAELAASLAGHLPCLGALLSGGAAPNDATAERRLPGIHEIAPVDVLSVLVGGDGQDGHAPPSAATANAALSPAPAAEPGSPTPPAGVTPEQVPTEAELPIQDYDSLAASQVVPRLATMSPEDLLAVRDYEQTHRNRQTILNRVAQRLVG